METSAIFRNVRLDAPFWAFLLLGMISAGSLVCFGIAAAQQTPPDAEIITTNNGLPPAGL